MANIVLEDPRYAALDQAAFNMGKKYGNDAIERGTQKDVNQGIQYLANLKMQEDNANKANQSYKDAAASLVPYANLVDLNRQWSDLDTTGVAANDPRRQDIIQKSQAARSTAAQNNWTVPDQTADYNTARLGYYDTSKDRIAQLADSFVKSGYKDASRYAPISDLGHDAGATTPVAFDSKQSLAGLGDIASTEAAKYQNLADLRTKAQTDLLGMHLSDAAIQKLAPAYESYLKGKQDTIGGDLLARLLDPATPKEEAIKAAQQYYSMNGAPGTAFMKDLAQPHSTAEINAGDRIQLIDVATPNKVGIGSTSATPVYDQPINMSPAQKASIGLQRDSLAQNDAHFRANLAKDASSIKQVIKGDDGVIYGVTGSGSMQAMGNVSGFSKEDAARVKTATNKMNYALKFYEASRDPYAPEKVTDGMTRALKLYDDAQGELDGMFGNKSQQSNAGSKQLTADEKQQLNTKYSDDQLQAAGYTW